MLDLQIDNRGDLVSTEPLSYPKLNIKWAAANNPMLKILFRAGLNKENYSAPKNNFKLMFYTANPEPLKEFNTIRSTEEIKQRIKVLLHTELGDIQDLSTYGTSLVINKHLDITSDAVVNSVQSIVLNVVSDILDDPSVKVVRAFSSSGPFYCQNLNVYIYDGADEIYEFELEG